MWFFLGNAIQKIEESVNGMLVSDNFMSNGNWLAFNSANNFVNYLIVFFAVFLVLGLMYYGYNESHRRNF